MSMSGYLHSISAFFGFSMRDVRACVYAKHLIYVPVQKRRCGPSHFFFSFFTAAQTPSRWDTHVNENKWETAPKIICSEKFRRKHSFFFFFHIFLSLSLPSFHLIYRSTRVHFLSFNQRIWSQVRVNYHGGVVLIVPICQQTQHEI